MKKKVFVTLTQSLPAEKSDALKVKLAEEIGVDPCCVVLLPAGATVQIVEVPESHKGKPEPKEEPESEPKPVHHKASK